MDYQEAKEALVIASENRDIALEAWPMAEYAIGIAGHLNDNLYSSEWNKHNEAINEILTLYPDLKNDHKN